MALNSISRKELLNTANKVTEDFNIETVRHKKKKDSEAETEEKTLKEESEKAETNRKNSENADSADEFDAKNDREEGGETEGGSRNELNEESTKSQAETTVDELGEGREFVGSEQSGENENAEKEEFSTIDEGNFNEGEKDVSEPVDSGDEAGHQDVENDENKGLSDGEASPETRAEQEENPSDSMTSGTTSDKADSDDGNGTIIQALDFDGASGMTQESQSEDEAQGGENTIQNVQYGTAPQTNVSASAPQEEPAAVRLSAAEEPVLARSFRLLPQTALFIKKRAAFEKLPEQSYVNQLFDKYANIKETVNIMELEPPKLHGASNKSIRLLEHVDEYIGDTCASYGMKRSEFFNYIVQKEMKAVGWA